MTFIEERIMWQKFKKICNKEGSLAAFKYLAGISTDNFIEFAKEYGEKGIHGDLFGMFERDYNKRIVKEIYDYFEDYAKEKGFNEKQGIDLFGQFISNADSLATLDRTSLPEEADINCHEDRARFIDEILQNFKADFKIKARSYIDRHVMYSQLFSPDSK